LTRAIWPFPRAPAPEMVSLTLVSVAVDVAPCTPDDAVCDYLTASGQLVESSQSPPAT